MTTRTIGIAETFIRKNRNRDTPSAHFSSMVPFYTAWKHQKWSGVLFPQAVVRRCSSKYMLKISQISQENTCVGVPF